MRDEIATNVCQHAHNTVCLGARLNRGFGIIRHNIPKVATNNSFGILRPTFLSTVA